MALNADELLLRQIEELRNDLKETRSELAAVREVVATVRAQATLFSGFISAVIAGFVTWVMGGARR